MQPLTPSQAVKLAASTHHSDPLTAHRLMLKSRSHRDAPYFAGSLTNAPPCSTHNDKGLNIPVHCCHSRFLTAKLVSHCTVRHRILESQMYTLLPTSAVLTSPEVLIHTLSESHTSTYWFSLSAKLSIAWCETEPGVFLSKGAFVWSPLLLVIF